MQTFAILLTAIEDSGKIKGGCPNAQPLSYVCCCLCDGNLKALL